MRRFLPLSLLAAAFLVVVAPMGASAVELHLTAEIARGAKQPVKQPVEWTVTRMFNDKKPGEAAATVREAAPTLNLEPGLYLVSAKLGLAKAEQTVELTKAPVLVRMNLNAGIVRLSMIPTAGAPVIKDNVHWELFPYVKGGGTSGRQGEANAPTAEFILPAHGWVVRATYDGTMAELVIPLEAGQTFNYTLNLYAGKAKVAATGPGGGAFKDPVMWEVVRASDRNDLVASTTAPNHQFTLREGSYVVLARQGTFAGEAPLEVKAGKTATAKVTMKEVPAAQVAALDAAAKKRVELAQAALAPKPAPKPAAKPAATQVAAAPAPAAAATAPAAAGGAPGKAQVVATGKSGKAFKDPVVWEVVAATDSYKLIASATAPTSEFSLPAGRYVLLAQQGRYAGQAPLDVKAGATATVKVPMAQVTAEQAGALEQATKKRVEMAAAAEAAADAAAPQAAKVSFTPSASRSLADTLKAAEEMQKAANAQGAAAVEAAAETAEVAEPAEAEAEAAAPAEAVAASDAAAPVVAPAAAPTVPPAETTVAAAAAAPEPAADQPDGSVKVTAWSKNVEKFRDAVEWEIRRVQPSGAVLPELVASHKSATHEFALPPGSYVIWGRQGTLIGKQKFEVEPEGTVAIRVFMQTPKVVDAPSAAASAEPEETTSASSGG